MKIRWATLLTNIAIPLAVGGASSILTMESMEAFSALNQPPLSPPGWLFPIVWSILYVLMGIAAYLAIVSNRSEDTKTAFRVYGVQLFFNFFWSIIFFNLRAYFFAFVWLLILWVLIAANIALFYKLRRVSGLLLIPYFLWVTFAGYLNLGIYLLNK